MPRGRRAGTTPAPEKRPTRPVRRTRAPRATPTTSAAPERSTGVALGVGHHPYFASTDGRGRYFVVRTLHGQHPEQVAGPFKTPRECIDRVMELNEKVPDAELLA